jgi:hypothetical protein
MEYYLAQINTFSDRYFYELVKANTKEEALNKIVKKYEHTKWKIVILDTVE